MYVYVETFFTCMYACMYICVLYRRNHRVLQVAVTISLGS